MTNISPTDRINVVLESMKLNARAIAVQTFSKKCYACGGPVRCCAPPRVPNEETVEAMEDARQGKLVTVGGLDDLRKDLNDEDTVSKDDNEHKLSLEVTSVFLKPPGGPELSITSHETNDEDSDAKDTGAKECDICGGPMSLYCDESRLALSAQLEDLAVELEAAKKRLRFYDKLFLIMCGICGIAFLILALCEVVQ